MWAGHVLVSHLEERKRRPAQQSHHHNGSDLHDPERFFAGFVDALNILPPVINRDGEGEDNRGPVDVEVRGAVKYVVNSARDPAVGVGGDHHFVQQSDNVLASRHTGDGAGQDVIEHQRGDAEFRECAPQSLFDNFIYAAAHKHRAALHVDGSHREREQHDADNEPGSGVADGLLGDPTGVKSGGGEIVQNDGRRAPVGDEREHHRRGDDDANTVGAIRSGLEGRRHSGEGRTQEWCVSSRPKRVSASSTNVIRSTRVEPTTPTANMASSIRTSTVP